MRRLALPILVAVALCAGTAALGAPGASAATPDRVVLEGSRTPWATPEARVADAGASDTMQFRVYLDLQDRPGAEATAKAVSDPASPSYRRFLTADEVRARYAPAPASVDAVRAWLASQGLAPGYVPANRLFVEASGPVSAVEQAFGVDLGIYSVRGQQVRAPAGPLSIPRSLAGIVSGVVGTSQSFSLMRPDHIVEGAESAAAATGGSDAAGNQARAAKPSGPNPPPADGFRNGRPCGTSYGQQYDTVDPVYGKNYPRPLPYAPCGYKPKQLRQAYGTQDLLAQGLDGRGTTVAIIDAFASPSIFRDAREYARRNDSTHPLTWSQFSQVVYPINHDLEGPDGCDAAGWWGEETLDVEAVHAMAPAADIVYVGGSDCQDVSLDKALNDVISLDLAQIVSNSYGNLGEEIAPEEVAIFQDIAMQGVLQGIGVYFSSGDSGDEVLDLGYASPDFSASSPWVTAVGGTTLGVGANGAKVLETGWETSRSVLTDGKWVPWAPGEYLYGSGGGTSRLFAQPDYQVGVVPDELSTKHPPTPGFKGRVVPDISMVGDPTTGMLIGQTQTFPEGVHYDEYRIGGTSLSSPLFAGLMALADQKLGSPHGFINPTIYGSVNGTVGITDVQHVQGAAVRVDFINGVDDVDGTRISVRNFDFTGLRIKTTPGYDNTTGLGVPNGLEFLSRV